MRFDPSVERVSPMRGDCWAFLVEQSRVRLGPRGPFILGWGQSIARRPTKFRDRGSLFIALDLIIQVRGAGRTASSDSIGCHPITRGSLRDQGFASDPSGYGIRSFPTKDTPWWQTSGLSFFEEHVGVCLPPLRSFVEDRSLLEAKKAKAPRLGASGLSFHAVEET